MKEADTNRAKAVCLRLLGIRARSRAELKERLEKRGFSGGAVRGALADLEQLGLVNDAEFARSWVEGRLRLKPVGRARLRWELRRRGVSEKIIAAAVKDALGEERELQIAQELAQTKMERFSLNSQLSTLNSEKHLIRLGRFLTGRGFSYEVIREVIGNLRTGGEDAP